jgi:photosynthetic reaction center H subunit
MSTAGAITSYLDVAQVVLYAFWIFFVGLIIYLRREDKREGYPLYSHRSHLVPVEGFPVTPEPKVFKLPHDGGNVEAPRKRAEAYELRADPVAPWPGAPLQPTGNPMLDGVGPASYANRADVPDLTLEGIPKIVPMRLVPGYSIEGRDPDPRGMPVVGFDNEVGGIVRDVWVDQSEPQIRYLEVEETVTNVRRHVLLPISLVKFKKTKQWQVCVFSILGRHFADVPGLRNPDQVTLLEEDRIVGYYGGGHLYATPERLGPLL